MTRATDFGQVGEMLRFGRHFHAERRAVIGAQSVAEQLSCTRRYINTVPTLLATKNPGLFRDTRSIYNLVPVKGR